MIRTRLDKNLESARAYVQRRQGSAVFFGRFTAALRVLVPGLAGVSEVHYPTFLLYNIAGGALYGSGFAVLGYVAGASYHRVEHIAGQAGLVLLGLIVAGLIASRFLRDSRPAHRALKPSVTASRRRLRSPGSGAGSPRRWPGAGAASIHATHGVLADVHGRRGGAGRLGLRWPHPRRDRSRRHSPG